MATPLFTTTYNVLVSDLNGCDITLSSQVQVVFPRRVFVANFFSPNGDGSNDLFLVQGGKGLKEVIYFRVFDRWGEMVYSASNVRPNSLDGAWDGTFRGKAVNSGTFVWDCEVLYEDGFREQLKGDMILTR